MGTCLSKAGRGGVSVGVPTHPALWSARDLVPTTHTVFNSVTDQGSAPPPTHNSFLSASPRILHTSPQRQWFVFRLTACAGPSTEAGSVAPQPGNRKPQTESTERANPQPPRGWETASAMSAGPCKRSAFTAFRPRSHKAPSQSRRWRPGLTAWRLSGSF